jgi:hypothetical protein
MNGGVRCDARKDRMTDAVTPVTTDATDTAVAAVAAVAADTAAGVLDDGAATPADTRSAAGRVRGAVGGAIHHLPDLLETTRGGAGQVSEHLPDAVARARLGAQGTATTLHAIPDATLRVLAAASIGLAAGLKLAGAPRLIALAAAAPALLAGTAIVTRQEEPGA